MSLADVTPVVLTFNEEPNVGRTLESLRPFGRVVVVDSGSTDRTEEIARSFGNVSWFMKPFLGHVAQWEWAIRETGIETAFVLALDADMSVHSDLVEEISRVTESAAFDAGLVGVEYRIRGVRLLGSLYPRELRLLRLSKTRVDHAGHTQKFGIEGRISRLEGRLVHDDRKPLEAFVRAQLGYSEKEFGRLLTAEPRDSRLRAVARRSVSFTPLLVWLFAWLRAGGPLRGAAARRYALERLIYEALLRWRVEDARLAERRDAGEDPKERNE